MFDELPLYPILSRDFFHFQVWKEKPSCLAAYWVKYSVAYRRLANWGRKFSLVGFSQKLYFGHCPADQGKSAPVATSYVSLFVFSKLRRGLKLKHYL
jgi:hypothetical protein